MADDMTKRPVVDKMETRGHATMEWKIVVQRTISCAWEYCFIATVGIYLLFPAIIVNWWCIRGARLTWSLLPYTGDNFAGLKLWKKWRNAGMRGAKGAETNAEGVRVEAP